MQQNFYSKVGVKAAVSSVMPKKCYADRFFWGKISREFEERTSSGCFIPQRCDDRDDQTKADVELVCIHHVSPTTTKKQTTHPFNGPCPGLPGSAGTRKVQPIWILLKQETVSGSGISWAICKSAPRSRQITTPAPHHSVFTDRMPFPPPNQQRQSTEGTIDL